MPDTMRIHRRCGVIVPSTEKECARCRESYRESWAAIPRNEAQLYWARLEGRLRCTSCENPVPINELATTSHTACPSCGRPVDFPEDYWKDWLEAARMAADLCGPERDAIDPEVWASLKKSDRDRHEVFDAIGKTGAVVAYSSVTLGGSSESWEVGPGHPCCEGCSQPLQVSLEGEVVTLACEGCGTSHRYALPASPHRIAGLVGVVAPAHLEGAATVKAEPGEGEELKVLRCPNCSGALSVPEGDAPYFPCPFCQASCYLPTRLREGSAAAVLTEPWWALFQGPSPEQESLHEKARAHAARRAEKEKKRLAREAQQKAESKERKRQKHEAEAAAAAKTRLGLVALGVAVALIVGTTLLFLVG
ncbi:MAG: hypothetical protein P1V51_23425 [Deltaproteobacteria bacterium]|nr:hypothetical protein [Deltaproteobacteria bacterium]